MLIQESKSLTTSWAFFVWVLNWQTDIRHKWEPITFTVLVLFIVNSSDFNIVYLSVPQHYLINSCHSIASCWCTRWMSSKGKYSITKRLWWSSYNRFFLFNMHADLLIHYQSIFNNSFSPSCHSTFPPIFHISDIPYKYMMKFYGSKKNVLLQQHMQQWFKDVLLDIPKIDLLGVKMAVIHEAEQWFLAAWNGRHICEIGML